LFTNLSLINRDVECSRFHRYNYIIGLSKVDKYLYSNEDHIKVYSMTLLGKNKEGKLHIILISKWLIYTIFHYRLGLYLPSGL